MHQVIQGVAAVLLAGISSCGGVSDSELNRACLDGGTIAEKRVSGPGSAQICSCMINQLSQVGLDKQDKELLVTHWRAQANRSFGGQTLPGSIEMKASATGRMPYIERCFF